MTSKYKYDMLHVSKGKVLSTMTKEENEDVIYIHYNGKPYCELMKID